MGGVPASNLWGMWLGRKPSLRTSRIISPPPRNGGIASSSSARAHNTPMPVGPHILWPVKPRKSAPSACTSVGRWGTYWAASTSTSAPASWAASARRRIGLSVPSTLLMAVTPRSLAPSRSWPRLARSSWPSAPTPIQRSSKPFSAAMMCQGTMLAWCSISVITTASPGPRLAPPHDRATRFIASVTFFVNTISSADGAFTNRAIRRSGRLHGLGGLGRDLVGAPVHVGIDRLVVAVHGVQHAAGLLRRSSRVQDRRWAGRGPDAPVAGTAPSSPLRAGRPRRLLMTRTVRSPRARAGRPTRGRRSRRCDRRGAHEPCRGAVPR